LLPEATFAQWLKKLRLERGLKRKEVSLAAEMNKGVVYLWEREYRRPRWRSLERAASVLGVTAPYIGRSGRWSPSKRCRVLESEMMPSSPSCLTETPAAALTVRDRAEFCRFNSLWYDS